MNKVVSLSILTSSLLFSSSIIQKRTEIEPQITPAQEEREVTVENDSRDLADREISSINSLAEKKKRELKSLAESEKRAIKDSASKEKASILKTSEREKSSFLNLVQQEREKFNALAEKRREELKSIKLKTTKSDKSEVVKESQKSTSSSKNFKPLVKRKLAGNMNITYKILPTDVDNFYDMFAKGITYGRLRMNMFKWDWKNEKEGKRKDNYALGVGGSLIFKTGRLKGFSGTVGLYTSQNPFMKMDEENVGYLKAGKDTLSRYDVKTEGRYGMTVLGEAYLQYDISKTKVKLGRQLFHSVFTKSNDTKMIPNTFDGLTIDTKDILNSRIQLAYFQAQKLRDHISSHDVITFKDENGESWANNDDSAIHKGLSYENLSKAGKSTHHELFIGTFENKTAIPNLQFIASYLTVPDIVNNLTLEAHYKIKMENWTIIPGVRYMKQSDDGGGEIGGASLTGKLAGWKSGDDKRGYDDPKNLDSSLFAGRIVLKNRSETTKILYGYSKVEDKADIVAPWRGFPTGGYTRAMGQYNWNANTVTNMIQVVYDFEKAGIIDGFKTSIRYAKMDFDDNKPDVLADRSIIHIDFWKKFKYIPNFETKVRIGMVDSDKTDTKDDTSYNEYRLEFNYLF